MKHLRILTSILSLLLCLCICTGCAITQDPMRQTEQLTEEITTTATPGPWRPHADSEATTTAQRPEETTTRPAPLPDPTPDPVPDPVPDPTPDPTPDPNPPAEEPPAPTVAMLNGTALSEFSIVYSATALDYTRRAAEYLRDQIADRTGLQLEVKTDLAQRSSHELVVGETTRPISGRLNLPTEDTSFSLLASGGSVAMEAEYFVIAAAAYYFVETYVTGAVFDASVPKEATLCQPIVETAENYLLLIGDGMGLYQTLLYDVMNASSGAAGQYSDGEDLFYGYLLPYMGLARTDSLSGVTDSAASGTALSTGYKTTNGRIGKDAGGNDLLSITELAASLGLSTAVMSTEVATGATPASFSAHALDRSETANIQASQQALINAWGTLIRGNYDYYTADGVAALEAEITALLTTLSQNENGFFMMYEEAHIDKHCHNMDVTNAFYAVVRFNQAIALFMEYAFYHPNTMVIITADHETSGMTPNGSGGYSSTHGSHSAQYVPVFAWGADADCFDGKVIENLQIPKTIAALMGEESFGSSNYQSLK